MWKFAQWLIERFDRGSTSAVMTKINQLLKNQETLMADVEKIKTDLADTKANLVEIQGDLNEVKDLNTKNLEKIGELEKSVDDLKKQLGDLAQFDVIAEQVAEIKTNSRSIADVIPEPQEPEPQAAQ